MSLLADVLDTQRAVVMQRWLDTVRGTLHPESMPRVELVDHLPSFLEQVVGALRAEHSPDEVEIAEEHGLQRLALGFSLDAVVREYGAMRSAMLAVAVEAGVTVTTHDYQVIFDCVVNGIAGAVSEYSRQRDAEMARQASEHFAFVAHELRNPLSSAVLALDALHDSGHLDASMRPVKVLERGLHNMRDLIDHSLRVARTGSGVDLAAEPVQLRALLQEAEAAVSLDADAKGIKLELLCDGEHELVVDVRLLRSALSNLVRNAIKFSHRAGTVSVRAKVASGRATIEIEDACGGLPDGEIDKVFSPFVQLGPQASSGFGLGLAIARQAVDAHGGTLRVQNLPTRGCIFVLDLPLAPATAIVS